MSDKPSFFAELKRRNVYKVAVAYGVVARMSPKTVLPLGENLRREEFKVWLQR
jgi:hypothetical protein